MDPRYEAFRGLFNAGKFFEAHEVLEEMWRRETGPDRDFDQGLIQIAAALVHFTRGNFAGAAELLSRAQVRLLRYPSDQGGLNTLRLLSDAWQCLKSGGKFPVLEDFLIP